MLALFVLVPLAGLVLLNLPFPALRRSFSLYVTAGLFAAQAVFIGSSSAFVAPDGPAFLEQLRFGFVADAFTRLVLFSIGLVGLAAALVASHQLTDERRQHSLASLMLVALIGMNGTASVTDFFSLYVFMEVAAIASFILIVLEHGLFAVEGAFRYLVLSAVAGAMMLSGVGLLVLGTDASSFEAVRAALEPSHQNHHLVGLGLGLFVSGLFIKGGVVPFHGWLPGAYGSAPSYVSVLLGGIVTKLGGIYALVRIAMLTADRGHTLSTIMLVAGAVSIVVGAVAAIGQSDMKRMLAYSSVSQVGYIVLALGAGTRLGIVAAAFHFFNHAVFKSLLFVDAAAVESRTGTTDMTKLGGVGAKMPITGVTTAIGMLSASGIPPFSGFWSKLLIVVALFQSDHPAYAVLAVLASILTLGYFMVMQHRAFFGKPTAELSDLREADPRLTSAAVVLSLVTVLVGLAFPLLLDSPLSFLLLDRKLPW